MRGTQPSSSDEIARLARIAVLRMTSRAKASHVGSALSSIDILSVLFDQYNFSNSENKLIFSKGHAASAYYAILYLHGKINESDLLSFGANETRLGGHVSHQASDDILLSTGSLGHGLPYAIGIANAEKLFGSKNKVFVVISDGECNEGTTWESALLANRLRLDNLVVVIDRNRIQSLGQTEIIMPLEPLIDKWKSFNWATLNIDGHSHAEISSAINKNGGPLCVIANTVKGKGVSFMENNPDYHHVKNLSEDLYLRAKNELQRYRL